MAQHLRSACTGIQSGTQAAAGVDRRKHQHGDIIAIMTGDHHILDVRCAGADHALAQRADTDPGAGGQLEVFCHPAVEQQALARIGRIGEPERVAHHVKAFVVEGHARQFFMLPVARRHARAAHPHFQLVTVGRELELHARHRQTDIAGALHHPIGEQRSRCGLGRAQAGDHRNALAEHLVTEPLHAVPDVLRQSRAGVHQHLQPAEEHFTQAAVTLEIRQQGLVALGHVEVDGRRHLLEVGNRLLDLARHRLAFVDVQGAAVEQHQVEIMVAAEGVVPGRPVEQYRRLVFQKRQHGGDHALVAAQHAMGVDDSLGHAGGTGGEEEFGDAVRAHLLMGGVHRWAGDAGCEFAEQRRCAPGRRFVRHQQLGTGRNRGFNRARENAAIGGEHQTRFKQRDDVLEFVKILRDQRIRHRHRRKRNADMHRRQCQEAMLDIVAGQDQQRPLRRQAANEQGLRQAPHLQQCSAVSKPAPAAACGAFGKEGVFGPFAGPADQRVGHPFLITPERMRRAQQQAAIGTPFDSG